MAMKTTQPASERGLARRRRHLLSGEPEWLPPRPLDSLPVVTPTAILALQRSLGNHRTTSLLHRRLADAAPVGSAPGVVQRDIAGEGKVPLGTFKIAMKKVENPAGKSGEDGTVAFEPDAKKGDRTSDIRLSQIVKTLDLTTKADADWSALTGGAEADRNKMMSKDGDRVHVTASGDTLEKLAFRYYGDPTRHAEIANQADNKLVLKSAKPKAKIPKKTTLKIPGAVKGGFFIDHLAADPKATTRTSKTDPNVPPDYVWPGEEIAGKNEHGFKKKGSIKAASLKDFPGTGGKLAFTFETAARATDLGIYYGSIHWSFEVESGKVSKEAFSVTPGVTETFREALDEFNKFYKNKHVVLKGETLQSIAAKYLGSPDKWKDIFNVNKDKIKKPSHIEPGWELTIPGVSAG